MSNTLKMKIYQKNQYIKDIQNAPMRDEFRGFPTLNEIPDNLDECVNICPTNAISKEPFSIDMGKCTFCGLCKKRTNNNSIDFSNYYKLYSTNREKLIITKGMTPDDFSLDAVKVREEIKKTFSKSLKLRQVSAGGCNGCEMELNACSNANFDMGRFGIDFVASPRHADGIVITGPITKNMAYALEDCYFAVPNPKIVILCGACAISGGIFQNSTEINRAFLEKYPVDLYIAGCPVHPLTFINGILDFIRSK